MDVGGRPEGTRSRSEQALTRSRLVPIAVAAALVTSSITLAFVVSSAGASGTTFVVDSVGDEPDISGSDGVCATALSTCTLRAAIKQANRSAGHDTIEFALPGPGVHRLTPSSRYPILDDPAGVTIDGYSQPGASANTASAGSNAVWAVEIQGTGDAGIDGIQVQSPDNVIQGLAMFDFKRAIYIRTIDAMDNEILGNLVGTDTTLTTFATQRVSSSNGIHIEQGASSNRIGKPGAANRNVISGNADKGIAIYNRFSDDNLIQNNVIGLAPSGESRLRNWGHGIDINLGAQSNIVGGASAGERNVISGNELSGVEISHNEGTTKFTIDNEVVGNLIGTNAAGTNGSSTFRNHEFGVNLEGKPSCSTDPDVCAPDISDNLVDGNVIVGSVAGVMIWKGAHDNTVTNNSIGVLADGTVAASSVNTIWGVLIEAGAFDNNIESNVIAGVLNGIQVRPGNDYACTPANPNCDEGEAEYPTFGNTFSQNSIHDITPGLGIDIWPLSVNNLPSELDPDVQGGIPIPIFTSATTDDATISTCADCIIELFVTDDFGSDYGQGRTFVASSMANSSGMATMVFRSTVADPYVVLAGELVSMTATDQAGNTSEFAYRVAVSPGSLGPPSSTTTTTSTTSSTTTTSTTTSSSTTTSTTTVPDSTTTTSSTTTSSTSPTTSTTTSSTTTTTTTVPGRLGLFGAANRGGLQPATRCAMSSRC